VLEPRLEPVGRYGPLANPDRIGTILIYAVSSRARARPAPPTHLDIYTACMHEPVRSPRAPAGGGARRKAKRHVKKQSTPAVTFFFC
jgi:hypothetical protein